MTDLERFWQDFDESFRALQQTLRSDRGIPHLGVRARPVGGDHWLFTPHAHNVLLWWRELAESQRDVRDAIVDAWAFHLQYRFAEHLSVNYPAPKGMRRRSKALRANRDRALVRVATELFAFREKVAWLVYDTVNSFAPLRIPNRRIGFATVMNSLRKLATDRRPEHAVIEHAFSRLDCDDARRVIEFRNTFTHTLRARVDSTLPQLMIQEKGTWDSIQPTPTLARHLLHCATWSWLEYVAAVRQLAAIQLFSHFSLCTRPSQTGGSQLPLHLHRGLECTIKNMPITVRCMSRCQGIVVEMPKDTSATADSTWTQFRDSVPQLLEQLITVYDYERDGVHMITGHSKTKFVAALIAKATDTRTLTELARDIGSKDIAENEAAVVPTAQVDFSKIMPTASWSSEARDIFVDMLAGKPYPPILSDIYSSTLARYNLIFSARSSSKTVEIKGLRIAGPDVNPIVIKSWAETADE